LNIKLIYHYDNVETLCLHGYRNGLSQMPRVATSRKKWALFEACKTPKTKSEMGSILVCFMLVKGLQRLL
jgi:hypothetical protein